MSPNASEIAESVGESIQDQGFDCLVMVTDGNFVSVYARGERNNIAAMAECASHVDVDRDFDDFKVN